MNEIHSSLEWLEDPEVFAVNRERAQKLVDIIKQNITLRLQEFVNLSDELILNTTVRNALESYEDMNSTQKYWTVQNIYSEVRSKYTRIADICDIRIVTVNNLPIYSTGFLYLNSEQDLLNYHRISQSEDPLLWYTTQYDEMFWTSFTPVLIWITPPISCSSIPSGRHCQAQAL